MSWPACVRNRPTEVAWEAAFEALPGAALVLDAAGRLLTRNAAARVLLGPAGGDRCALLRLSRLPPGGTRTGFRVRDAARSGR